MAVYNYRMFKTSTPRNTDQMSNKVANGGVLPYSGYFETETNFPNSRAQNYIKSSFLYDKNVNIAFNNEFTIAMWLKFNNQQLDNIKEKLIIVKFSNDDFVNTYLPDSIDGTIIDYYSSFHYLSIIRDSNNLITFRLDGKPFYTETNSSPLDMTNGAYVYIGNSYYNSTNKILGGTNIYADDILLSDSVETFATSLPTTYYSNIDYSYNNQDYSEFVGTGTKSYLLIY